MTAQPWEPRVARLEGAYEQVDKRLDSIDHRLETLDRKIDGLQGRMTSLILGTWATTWITLMLAIIFRHG